MNQRTKIIGGVLLVLVLALAFWWGGNGPGLRGWPANPQGDAQLNTPPSDASRPEGEENQEAEPGNQEPSCTIAIRCDTILNHMDWLSEDKHDLVPEDGQILAPKRVSFTAGENAFGILLRELKAEGIHMEYTGSADQGTAYIKGIHNLYEYDCGERSGWLYYINREFPTTSVSQYEVQDGDLLEWIYTCDYGDDVVLGAEE